jgi:hypothetical protein
MPEVNQTKNEARFVDISIPDSELTREQIIERNMKVVDAHFHNENPETIVAAMKLYGDTISWEGPSRGVVLTDKSDVLASYRGIFRTLTIKSYIPLRRFATEKFVFDDQIAHATIVGDEMVNLPFPKGTDMSVRLAHVFEMKDGKIIKEIAYEIFRKEGAPNVADAIPEGCEEVKF